LPAWGSRNSLWITVTVEKGIRFAFKNAGSNVKVAGNDWSRFICWSLIVIAQWANALAGPQCSGPGLLTLQRGFDSHCRHVESGFCMP